MFMQDTDMNLHKGLSIDSALFLSILIDIHKKYPGLSKKKPGIPASNANFEPGNNPFRRGIGKDRPTSNKGNA